MKTETIEIKPNKIKYSVGLLCSLALTAASIFILISADEIGRLNPAVVRFIGYFGILFFGLGGGFAFFKALAKSKIGLTLNSDGILDNASGDFIRWTSIRRLRVSRVAFVKFISIDLDDPNDFLNGQNGLRKIFGWLNYKMVGTPVNISSSILNIEFDELFEMIDSRLKDHLKNN